MTDCITVLSVMKSKSGTAGSAGVFIAVVSSNMKISLNGWMMTGAVTIQLSVRNVALILLLGMIVVCGLHLLFLT